MMMEIWTVQYCPKGRNDPYPPEVYLDGHTASIAYETRASAGGFKWLNKVPHTVELPEREKVYCGWNIEDAKTVCPSLTDTEARLVMEKVQHQFDAEAGVCWDNLRDAAHQVFPRRKIL